MSTFFIMECSGEPPIAGVDLKRSVYKPDDMPWMNGAMISAPKQVLVYATDPDYPGNLKAMYGLSAPLMRMDLIQALEDGGVDNIQFFDAVIRDVETGVEHKNYRAFNILGLVSGADMEQSEFMSEETVTGIDRDFAKLVLDEKRIPSALLLFRLAESSNAIVVHKKIKELIEARGIEGMDFYGPGEWSG